MPVTVHQACFGVGEIDVKVGYFRPPPFMGINPDQNWIDDDDEFKGVH